MKRGWYEAAAEVVTEIVQSLEERITEAKSESRERAISASVYFALWNSCEDIEPVIDSGGWSSERWARAMARSAPTLVVNTLRAVIEPVLAKRSAIDAPRTVWMATDASYEQRRAAAELTDFFTGLAALPHGGYADLSALARSGVLIAGVGTGSIAAFPRWSHGVGRIEVELDDTLALYVRREGGRPGGRILEVVRTYEREASTLEQEFGHSFEQQDDCERLVCVTEGWLLASGDSPGRHVVACRDGNEVVVLRDEEHAAKEPPCAILHVSPPVGGSQWALPLSHHIRTALAVENEAISDWVKVFRSLPAVVATYRPDELANPRPLQDSEAILAVELAPGAPRDAAVQVSHVPRVSNETQAFIDRLRSGILDVTGVSEPTIRGDRTEGTRSGKHEAYVAQLTTERQAILERDIIAWRTIALARATVPLLVQCLEEHSGFAVVVTGDQGRRARRLALSDIDLSGAETFALRPAAVSEEVDSPRARREQIQARFDSGQITVSEYIEALRHLDATSGGEAGEAVTEFFERQHRRWLSLSERELATSAPEDVLVAPMAELGVMALDSLQRQASIAYLRGLNEGLPGPRLELIALFLQHTSAALSKARVAAMPPQPVPTGAV